LDPEHWRKELQTVKDLGFNLMKFCLWVPPKGYLEMADAMGVLVWIEYPTWHSQWTQEALPTLEKEFDEFFCYDRNHPSVILRSLTCETGPSADLEVLRKLYDRCHSRIPGSIVEDDSSWIQWNRIHDFYEGSLANP
jgi:beta-galactosidase/beta-glucuronidase